MYIKVNDDSTTVWPYTIDQLVRDNSNVSFPSTLNATVLSDFGVYKVVPTAPPEYDMLTQDLHQDTPQLVDGEYRQVFRVEDRSETDAGRRVRRQRDTMLIETDHYAMSDRTMSDEMRVYRQALRDVPTQAGFPQNVTWPEKP